MRIISFFIFLFSFFHFTGCAGLQKAEPISSSIKATECSSELNRWNYPEDCVCGSMESDSDVTYDPTLGKCVKAVHATGVCTMDQNPWGHASLCQCPDKLRYNQVIGLCVQE